MGDGKGWGGKGEPLIPFGLRRIIFISSDDNTSEHGSLENKIRARQPSSLSSSLTRCGGGKMTKMGASYSRAPHAVLTALEHSFCYL